MKPKLLKLKPGNPTGATHVKEFVYKGKDAGLSNYQLFKDGKSMGCFIGSVNKNALV